jgi:3'(2'), 5'-bisphosphate nucleotidase
MSATVIEPGALPAMLEPLTAAVAMAGAVILAADRAVMEVAIKADNSPITRADRASCQAITRELARTFPQIPIVSEENLPSPNALTGDTFFMVDPLDGTREYIAGSDEFTVNLALVWHGRPVIGVIGLPTRGLVWRGLVGVGAERLTVDPGSPRSHGPATPIHARKMPAGGGIAIVSRSHLDDRTRSFLAGRPNLKQEIAGSALKFCRVAEGSADIYPRLGPTAEWDIAAGHALLTAAGGAVTNTHGQELRFGQQADGFRVPDFIAWGDPVAAGL